MTKEYKVIGLMSGTSLDGLDIAFCHFTNDAGQWTYKILEAENVDYSQEMKKNLSGLMQASAEAFARADFEFGYFMGKAVKEFCEKHRISADFVSSHGHTIFHQPKNGFTFQIGNGAAISASSGLPVVCDFRSMDVAMGGQGAPLVPIGDKLLFSDYDVCLNLGGIANISADFEGRRIAFDTSAVNQVLNHYAGQKGKEYDAGGQMAAGGSFHPELFNQLNMLPYFKAPFPKSLGKEWVDSDIYPLIEGFQISIEDKLHTFCRHTAYQINDSIKNLSEGRKLKVLVTGGGAFNDFLVGELRKEGGGVIDYIIPDKKIVMFKEALIFAFLGILRARNEVNCLKSVTGANRDNIGGCIYGKWEF